LCSAYGAVEVAKVGGEEKMKRETRVRVRVRQNGEFGWKIAILDSKFEKLLRN